MAVTSRRRNEAAAQIPHGSPKAVRLLLSGIDCSVESQKQSIIVNSFGEKKNHSRE